jgi:hypothetical protein
VGIMGKLLPNLRKFLQEPNWKLQQKIVSKLPQRASICNSPNPKSSLQLYFYYAACIIYA